jgi:signal transduction histidine kinase
VTAVQSGTLDDGDRKPAYAAGMSELQVEAGPDGSPRRSLIVDGALAAGLAVVVLLGTDFASQHQPARRPFDAGAAALIVLAAGALVLRRRYPVAVMAVVFGAILVYFSIGYPNSPIWLILVTAYVTAVFRGHRVAAAIVAGIGLVTVPWLDFWFRKAPAPSFAVVAGLAAWLLVLLGTAEIVRIRRERAVEAIRVRREETLRRASEERLRIARELHDALGHHLSLISVQSGVALHLNDDLPEEVRTSLTAIRDASNEGLSELRSVLDVLRQDGERAPRSPTSTLGRLDDLVSQSAAAGLEVLVETEGEPRPLPFGVDVAAFRIVQEALTNVTRHARGAVATVRVIYGERLLTVEVEDDGAGTPTRGSVGTGKGIVGMRERVGALGGELQAGPGPRGGFRVRARLPLDGHA